MDKLLPETQEILQLMEKITAKQDELHQLHQDNKRTQTPKELSALFRREKMDSLLTNAASITAAVSQVAEKDDELRIFFCEANELCDKQKDGTVRLCSVSSGHWEQLSDLLTSEIPAADPEMDQVVKECDRLSGLMEKKTVQVMRTASELKNAVRRLDMNK